MLFKLSKNINWIKSHQVRRGDTQQKKEKVQG